MSLYFCSFASGSSGNSYLVGTDRTALIIDAGIAFRNIEQGLAGMGLTTEDISGILITHEHGDHIKSLRTLIKKTEALTYASQGTLAAIIEKYVPSLKSDGTVSVTSGEIFTIGDIEVTPFDVSHDAAEPLGYAFRNGGKSVAIMTDTGIVTGSALEALREADIIVIESNHEENVLMFGSYPFHLKKRILSEHGHLSNGAAAGCLAEVLGSRSNTNPPKVALAHLSKENNTPDLAFLTIKNMLAEDGFTEGVHYSLEVLPGETGGGCATLIKP
ncbi:MAG: MBL fold metallo-hydrolase [Firmicutes bacterium]|nr:MBL fold metallo-hydrolase [Bacillota bacterium]